MCCDERSAINIASKKFCSKKRKNDAILASFLALTLLVLWIFADDPEHPFALDQFTFVADRFDRCSDFHETLYTFPNSYLKR